jgi:hypothetical protein
MNSEKVARLLTDFDRPDLQKGRSRVVPFDHTQHSSAKTQPKPPPVQRDDDAYQRGRSEGYAAAAAEYEQKLNDESQKLRAVLTEERDNVLNETAAKIVRDIGEIGNQLETKIAAVTARVLEPFISSAVQKKAVASFVEQLSSLTSDTRRPTLRISGPSDLLELVRSKLGVRSIAVELRATQGAEVSIIVDELVLETQLKLWVERMKFSVQT